MKYKPYIEAATKHLSIFFEQTIGVYTYTGEPK